MMRMGAFLKGTRIIESESLGCSIQQPQLYNVVQWTAIPFPHIKQKEYLHTTNSQTEEEVAGSETKQRDAKIQSVKNVFVCFGLGLGMVLTSGLIMK